MTTTSTTMTTHSIEGCKKTTVPVVYTPWANLKKTGDMDVRVLLCCW